MYTLLPRARQQGFHQKLAGKWLCLAPYRVTTSPVLLPVSNCTTKARWPTYWHCPWWHLHMWMNRLEVDWSTCHTPMAMRTMRSLRTILNLYYIFLNFYSLKFINCLDCTLQKWPDWMFCGRTGLLHSNHGTWSLLEGGVGRRPKGSNGPVEVIFLIKLDIFSKYCFLQKRHFARVGACPFLSLRLAHKSSGINFLIDHFIFINHIILLANYHPELTSVVHWPLCAWPTMCRLHWRRFAVSPSFVWNSRLRNFFVLLNNFLTNYAIILFRFTQAFSCALQKSTRMVHFSPTELGCPDPGISTLWNRWSWDLQRIH